MKPVRTMQEMLPWEIRETLKACPVAYIPIGTLEWHGEHLPLGVDALIASRLMSRVAAVTGGVVLPASHLSCGLLSFPFCLNYDQKVFDRNVRDTLEQVRKEGFRCMVALTGHGPMDQIHTIKAACEDLMVKHPEHQAFGLCWFELLVDSGEELIVDHAAKVETSLMQELCPELVDLSKLSDDPEETPMGVYGKNPKFTASPEWGRRMADHFVKNMSRRVRTMLEGERVDNYRDLRNFVSKFCNQPLRIAGAYRVTKDGIEFDLYNDSGYSRYISGITQLQIDQRRVPIRSVTLTNLNPGEGKSEQASELSPIRGFYIRRFQSGTVQIKGLELTGGSHALQIELQLSGVTDVKIEGTLTPS